MKQHITVEQLNKLSDKGREKLRKWWKPVLYDWYCLEGNGEGSSIYLGEDDYSFVRRGGQLDGRKLYYVEIGTNVVTYANPLLSIGQMIGFLQYDSLKIFNGPPDIAVHDPEADYHVQQWNIITGIERNHNQEGFAEFELCDALWEAVKIKLEENDKKAK